MSDEFKRRDVFNKAADLVAGGWCKGKMQSRRYAEGQDYAYCAVGAVLQASGFYDDRLPDADHDEAKLVPADGWWKLRERLMTFNDRGAKDKTEVVKVLREVGATGTFKLP